MNKKMLALCTGVLVLLMAIPISQAFANGRPCGPGGRGGPGELDKMFFKKAHTILKNQAELGLTAEKAEALKALKFETLKAMIRQNAEIQVIDLDLCSQLHSTTTDMKTLNALIDQKYELKKSKDKLLTEAVVKMKGLLSKEQIEKLRALRKDHKKKECPMPRQDR